MSAYSTSHPWLRFTIDLSRFRWDFWLAAGEALSKCEHLAGVPLGPEAAKELMTVYLAKGVLATTAIEGNTLSELEVRQRIDGTLKLPPSKEYLGVEVDNIVQASNDILRDCRAGNSRALTLQTICEFNKLVLRGLELDDPIVPGKLREYSVGVADYRGAPAAELAELIDRLCRWLNEPWLQTLESLGKPERIRLEAILKAIIAHLYLAWIHPFGDGNGRTARLVEFFILARAGIPFPAAHLLSNHYNETRSAYYQQLSRASKSGGDIAPFCMYAIQGLVDQLRSQIQFIRDQQFTLFWQNHVHQTLGDTQTARRRRYLVLDLANSPGPVTKAQMTDISVRVLRQYMGKNEKTLTRDLQELERLNLIRREGGGYRANKEIVLAYLPPTTVA